MRPHALMSAVQRRQPLVCGLGLALRGQWPGGVAHKHQSYNVLKRLHLVAERLQHLRHHRPKRGSAVRLHSKHLYGQETRRYWGMYSQAIGLPSVVAATPQSCCCWASTHVQYSGWHMEIHPGSAGCPAISVNV